MNSDKIQKIARENIHILIPEVQVDTAACIVTIDQSDQNRFEYFSGAACTGESDDGRLEYHADEEECISALIDAVINEELAQKKGE